LRAASEIAQWYLGGDSRNESPPERRRMPSKNHPPISPDRAEIRRMEALFDVATGGREFYELQQYGKWGEPIRETVLKPMRRGDPQAIEDAIVFLEENPRFFRSGYHKGLLAAALKSAALSDDQIARLRQVVLEAAGSPKVGPEFKEYARLAVRLAHDPFIGEVTARVAPAYGSVKRRLEWILRLWRAHGARSPHG
jgi:hypothetical protein